MKEQFPTVLIHPDDAAALAILDGAWVRLKNHRGDVVFRARIFHGLRRGVLICESVWPNSAFPHGRGINTLTSADLRLWRRRISR